jgi:AcrR family transcriptional regulator
MPRAAALPPEERRAQILDAVEPVIRQHGRQVNTRQLAEAAGVAEGTLFRVFDSKKNLIDAVIGRYIGAERTLDRLVAIDRDLPLEDRLIAVAETLQNRLTETFELLHAVGPPPDPSAEDRIAFRDHMVRQTELITEAIADLIKPDADLLVVTPAQLAQLLGSLTFSTSHPLMRHMETAAALSREPAAIIDLALHGCLIDSTRTRPGFDHPAAEQHAAGSDCVTATKGP